tara:strand:- start:582 stop:836 length:255 start_codon:yes stop_codon:yes gene_type:complete
MSFSTLERGTFQLANSFLKIQKPVQSIMVNQIKYREGKYETVPIRNINFVVPEEVVNFINKKTQYTTLHYKGHEQIVNSNYTCY